MTEPVVVAEPEPVAGGLCRCPEPWLHPDDPEEYCWRCRRFLLEGDD